MPQRVASEQEWSQLRQALRRFIRRRVSDDHTADDLVQETLLRVHRSIGQLRSADRMSGWVYRIARNVVQDHYRTSRAAGGVEAGPLVEDAAAPAADAGCERGARWMEELIGQIPATYQAAVRLAELQGLTQREVADRLGLSLSGAKSRVQRGRALLKEALERCCVFHLDSRGRVYEIDPKPERTACLDCDGSDPFTAA